MTGETQGHNRIALNTASLLRDRVRGTGCIAYMSDLKVRLEAAATFYYPDVVVTCDARDSDLTSIFIGYPCLVVEVLSPSMQAFERGNKFADYRTVESLREDVDV